MAGLALAATGLLAACGGDDDGPPQSNLSEDGGSPLGTAQPANDGAAGAGDERAFCDWFNASGPRPDDWNMDDAASIPVPAEIAGAFEAVVAGDRDLSLQSEVTRWVTENCF